MVTTHSSAKIICHKIGNDYVVKYCRQKINSELIGFGGLMQGCRGIHG